MLSDSDSTVCGVFVLFRMGGGVLNIACNHDPCFVLIFSFFGGEGVSTFSSQHHHHHQNANYVSCLVDVKSWENDLCPLCPVLS